MSKQAAKDETLEDQETCDHDFDPDDGYHCLNCGLDGTEEVMARAYDRAKDFRKYGE